MKFIKITLTEGFEPVRINVNDIHKYRKHLTNDGNDKARIELNSFKIDKKGNKVREVIIADMSVAHIDELINSGLWKKTV